MEEQPSIGYFLSEMENAVNEGKKVSFGKSVVVDKKSMLDMVDKIRCILPQMTGEAFVNKAKQDAERIRQNAEMERAQLVESNEIVKEARERANKIIMDAQIQAQRLTKEASDIKEEYEKKYKAQTLSLFGTLHNNLAEAMKWVDTTFAYINQSNDKKE